HRVDERRLHQLAGHLHPYGPAEAAAHLLQRDLARPVAGQAQAARGAAEPGADFRLELLGGYRDGQPALEAGCGLNGNVHDLIEDFLELAWICCRRPPAGWGGRWVSNPRPPGSQPGALPTELRPPSSPSSRQSYSETVRTVSGSRASPVVRARRMARPEGIEPSTAGLEGRCSIRLSYGRVVRGSVRLGPPAAGGSPATAHGGKLVGVERFELPTSCSQSRRATRLRYTPQ